MQHVKRQWLSLYAYVLLAVDAIIVAAYIWMNSGGRNPADYAGWGITTLILVLAVTHALYILLIFPFIRKRFEWQASLLSVALFVILTAAIIETSQYNNLVIRLGYAALVFSLATVGPFAPIATIVATWVFLLYTYFNVLNGVEVGISIKFEIFMDILVTVAGITGLLVFRKFYVKKKDRETIVLSKLLEQEQFKSGVILESITDGVMVINTKGTVQVLNESAASLLGWPKNEALKLDYRSLLKPIDTTQQTNSNEGATTLITNSLANSKPEQGVVLLSTKNGRQLFVDIVVSPIMEAAGLKSTEDESREPEAKRLVGVIAVLRDVDEQKRQEQQRSEFISTASHEMRTPVASIQGFLELALNPKVASLDPKIRAYLEKAHGSAKHLGGLFQDLLTVAQSDDGRLSNNPEIIEVNELLHEVTEQGKLPAESKGLNVVLEEPKATSGRIISPLMYVHVDKERLHEVVANLLDNAIKYTSKGTITIGASTNDTRVTIRVSDTGMGIAEEDLPHLFQKFYRTDNSSTREVGGTGLGLYISKQIVEMMGGKIWIESTVGAGSTFFVEIPRVDPKNVPPPAEPQQV